MSRSPRGSGFLRAPSEPIVTRPMRVDAATTPASLTRQVLLGCRRYSLPAGALSITHQLGEALVPVLMGIAIERAVSSGDIRELLLWLAVLAADFVLLSFSWRFGSRLAELAMLVVQHNLRSLVVEHLLLRPGSRRRTSDAPGVALSLATSDVNRLSYAVEIGVYPLGQLAAVLFGGAVLLSISWPLGLAVLLGVPLLLWATEAAGADLRRRSELEQAAAASAASGAADLMAGYRVIRGIGAEREASSRYQRASRTALESTVRARRSEGVFGGVMDLASGLFLAGIALAAGLLAVSGALGLGELITVVGLTQFLVAPLQSITKDAGSWWAAATASAARLLDLLREDDNTEAKTETEAEIEHDDRPPVVPRETLGERMDEVLAGVRPGELVAVSVDGVLAERLLAGLSSRHPSALVAPHQPHLFSGSVRQNVALPGVPPMLVGPALQATGCDELAEALPQGLDSDVGEGGSALSGGQRQRVALARALARDAPLLVLHDPTTAVDAVTEAAIARDLRGMRTTGRTLVVTRSPAFLATADRVVHMDDDPVPTEASR